MMVLGLVTIWAVQVLGGAILTLVGLAMYFFYRRLERRSQRMAEASRGKGGVETQTEPAVVREKEIHVVVRIPCEHCGVLNEQLRAKCESCGAPLR
jgi:membrane protein implicated in regulation of membrane protease activity